MLGPKPGEAAPVVDHVKVTNGTIDGKTQSTYFGFVIGVSSTNVILDHVSFTGSFGYNADYGASDTVSNGTILGLFTIISQGYLNPTTLDPNFKAGYGSYSNLVVNQTGSWAPQWTGTALSVQFAMYPVGPNNFTNITDISGNVQLGPNDTYSNINVPSPYQITGGIQLQ